MRLKSEHIHNKYIISWTYLAHSWDSRDRHIKVLCRWMGFWNWFAKSDNSDGFLWPRWLPRNETNRTTSYTLKGLQKDFSEDIHAIADVLLPTTSCSSSMLGSSNFPVNRRNWGQGRIKGFFEPQSISDDAGSDHYSVHNAIRSP